MTSTVSARRRAVLALGAMALVGLAACGGDNKGGGATSAAPTTAAPGTTPTSGGSGAATTAAATASGVTMEAISPERCNQNKAAGKITFLTSFDFSAAASILDVTVAKEKGYFDAMCLDVDLKAG